MKGKIAQYDYDLECSYSDEVWRAMDGCEIDARADSLWVLTVGCSFRCSRY